MKYVNEISQKNDWVNGWLLNHEGKDYTVRGSAYLAGAEEDHEKIVEYYDDQAVDLDGNNVIITWAMTLQKNDDLEDHLISRNDDINAYIDWEDVHSIVPID